MEIRTVITESSVWKFDTIEKQYVRFPRTENPGQASNVPYTCTWEPYVDIIDEGEFLVVVRPVPFGTGQLRKTGPILYDSDREEHENDAAETSS